MNKFFRCIRNLHYFECVSLVPLFLYGNTYVATEKLHEFFNNVDDIEVKIRFFDVIIRRCNSCR